MLTLHGAERPTLAESAAKGQPDRETDSSDLKQAFIKHFPDGALTPASVIPWNSSSAARLPFNFNTHIRRRPEQAPTEHMDDWPQLLPTPKWRDPAVLCIISFYFFLFIIGLSGNSAVLNIVRHVRKHMRRTRTAAAEGNALGYLACLLLVDYAVVLCLPMAIADLLLGFWMFGDALCKLFAFLEAAGKTLSTFILVAMSFVRYAAVCHPARPGLRSAASARTVIAALTVLSGVILFPVVYYSQVHVRRQSLFPPENPTMVVVTYQCEDNGLERVPYAVYTLAVFLLSYGVPLPLIVFFYGSMIGHLREHMRQMPSSSLPLRRITRLTVAVSAFHFLCWTPYWAAHLILLYAWMRGQTHTLLEHDAIRYGLYVVQSMPYVNSAFNWVFYGLFNRQLQQQIGRMASDLSTRAVKAESKVVKLVAEHGSDIRL